jgi:putative selenate reductase
MVFCPENGDPAKVKPRLYLDRDRFAMGAGQGFLIDSDNGRVSIEPRTGFEPQVDRLDELLNHPTEGIPIRAADL